ncbi:hypothetical protein NQ317_001115 [Molorchus minor]|uniref:Hepatocyte growth factor-regulated tyrosine kinase substrate n=1 Tax=Molorchus minor TaxID=1323400 RepID=A0ABQ9JHT0_9CUCU|nr:hypothetical protein NQ317_001115 [Molorchus minor]
MFRANNFDKLLDKATSHLLMEPEWPSIIQICDLIRQNDVQPRHALTSLKKKLTAESAHSIVCTSCFREYCAVVHEELTTKPFCEFLQELAKVTPHENSLFKLGHTLLEKNPKHSAIKDVMNTMKAEGYKFPVLRESDAMFSADTAPEWVEGNVCHRCRVNFGLIQRRHHCRACGQVFCGQCTSRTATLPKYGIEKEVRVCDVCYDQVTKPSSASKSGAKSENELPAEYLSSSLAQQSQEPPKKSEDELREEEELQLALALSQSEAEAKEKAKFKMTSSLHSSYKVEPPQRSPSPIDEQTNPELAKYLNRSYWESIQTTETNETPASPSAPATAPATAPAMTADVKTTTKEETIKDGEIEEFIKTLKSQVEIFINRMKSNSSRGRSIANDTSVQTLFMSITAMHSRLLRYIQEHDDSRLYYEGLQDKLTQVKDARAALDALREEYEEKLKREAEEAERQRQLQMAHKLDIMRKKKQEYLQYQRQLALQRIQEQEREMQMRQEQQKQQYLMPQYGGYMGSPVHGQQFPQNAAPSMSGYQTYQYANMMPPQGLPPQQMMQGPLQPPQMQHNPSQIGPPPGFPPMQQSTTSNHSQGVPHQPQLAHHGHPSQPMMGPGMPHMGMQQPQGMPPVQGGMPNQKGMPPNPQGMPINQPGMLPHQGPPNMQMNRVGLMTSQGSMMPNQGGMMLNQSGMVPNQGGMMPERGGMMPNQGGMIPNQGSMMLNQERDASYAEWNVAQPSRYATEPRRCTTEGRHDFWPNDTTDRHSSPSWQLIKVVFLRIKVYTIWGKFHHSFSMEGPHLRINRPSRMERHKRQN